MSTRAAEDQLVAAIRVIKAAGIQVVVQFPANQGVLSARAAAARLDVGVDWIKAHCRDEFPGWYRLPAGSSAQGNNVGEIRIPVADLEAWEERRRKARA